MRKQTTALDVYRSLQNHMCEVTGLAHGQQQPGEAFSVPLLPFLSSLHSFGMVCVESWLVPLTGRELPVSILYLPGLGLPGTVQAMDNQGLKF